MRPGPNRVLIGTLNAPNGLPRVVPWPCVPCIKHKNNRFVLLISEAEKSLKHVTKASAFFRRIQLNEGKPPQVS